jgi:hypothetical protein
MIIILPRLFPLGQVVATPNALASLTPDDIQTGFQRHVSGDWGDLEADDVEENQRSLKNGYRLFSVYHAVNGTKFYIITEADRSVTTVLLPEDY